MLNAIRKQAAGWLAKGLFALLIASFAVWGITDYMTPSTDPVVAKVGNHEITSRQVGSRFREQMQELRRQFGPNFTEEMGRELGLQRQALELIVGERLILLEAERLGIVVPDSAVRQAIADEPAFQGPTGSLDANRFRQVLFQAGMSEGQYVELLRRELLRRQIGAAVTFGAMPPDPLVEAVVRHREERRRITTTILPVSADGIAEPDEGQIEAFYRENENRYAAPERRDVTVLLLTAETVGADVDLSEDALRAAYEERLFEFTTDEMRHIDQLLFRDEEQAANAMEQLASGSDMPRLVGRLQSEGVAEFIEIGSVTRAEVVPRALAEAAFDAQEPGFIGPVRSAVGWHVIHVAAIEPATETPFEKAREQLIEDLRNEQAVDRIIDMANRIEDELLAGGSLEQAAEAVGVDLVRVPAADAVGMGEDGQPVEVLADYPELLELAFDTTEAETSQLIDLSDNGYGAVRVDRITAAAPQPLNEVRADVIEDWRRDAARRASIERGEALADDARSRGDFAAAAAEAGVEVLEPEPVRRDQSRGGEGLSTQVVEAAFGVAEGEIVVVPTRAGIVVAQVVERIPAGDIDENTRLRVADSLGSALEREIEADYAEALRRRFGVEINEAALARVF